MGSYSIHGVAWLDDDELENCLDEKGVFSEDKKKEKYIQKLVDKWVSCSLNADEVELNLGRNNAEQKKAKENLISLVKGTNVHRHTDSCRKYKTDCRYEFPRFFTSTTIIANELKNLTDEEKKTIFDKQKIIFNKVAEGYKLLDLKKDDENLQSQYDECPGKFLVEICKLNPIEDPSLLIDFDSANDDIDSENSNMSIEEAAALKLYMKALSFTEKGRKIFLRRKISERFVNNYNPLIHSVWQANTDIQVALDTHAVISYITDYMTKSDKGLTANLAKALKEKKRATNFEQLNHIKQVYFNHKQTCISEAAYRLLPGLCLKKSSCKAVTLTSGFPQNRKLFAWSKGEDQKQDGFEIEGIDGNYEFKANRFDYYESRPKDIYEDDDQFYETEILSLCTDDDEKEKEKDQNALREKHFNKHIENMCFAEFNMNYERVTKSSIASTYHFVTCLAKRTEEEMEKDREKKKKRQKKTSKKDGTKKRKGNKGIKIIDAEESDSKDSTEDSDPPLPPYKVTAGIGFNSKVDQSKEALPPYIYLIIKNVEVYFKLRKKPFILRTYRGKRKDAIEELYSELLLFTSWRNEKATFKIDDPNFSEIIQHMCKEEVKSNSENVMDGNENSAEDERKTGENESPNYLLNIKKRGEELNEKRKKVYPFTDKMTELKKLLEEAEFLGNSEMESMLDPSGEQQNAEDDLDQDDTFYNDSTENPEYQSTRNTKSTSKKEKCIFKIPDVEDSDTLKSKVRSLSYEQRVVFDLFVDFCQKVKCAFMYKGNIDPVPPKIIVHGGGGVGKSFLIQLLSQWIQKILSTWGDVAEYPKLTRFAFTGAAAYLIGKLY